MTVSVAGPHRRIVDSGLGVGFGRNRWLSWRVRRRGWRFGRLVLVLAGGLAAIWSGKGAEIFGLELKPCLIAFSTQ